MDKKGHPVTSRFLVIRPRDSRWRLEVLWAICNSPLANAYSYAFSGKRDVLAGLVREMPLPPIDPKDTGPLRKAVKAYLRAVRATEHILASPVSDDRLRALHWRIDAEVLRLYALPPGLERQLLDLFTGAKRRGVPFAQTEYMPRTFTEPLTLRELLAITVDWQETNARRSRLILREENS
jgi:hypothetical protein